MFSRTQLRILGQILASVSLCVLILYLTEKKTLVLPITTDFQPDMSAGERLVFALRCLAFSIVPLYASIQDVALRRLIQADTLGADPTATVPPHQKTFLISQRILQNTLEQTILHAFVVLALASSLDGDQLQMVQLLVLLFVVGRAAFYFGYRHNPLYRGFGFALTFIPSVAGLVYVLFLITFD